MITENVTNPQKPAEDEIDLIALAKTLWNGRRTIILFLVIFTALGVFVAIYSPVEYTVRTVMVPQMQSKSSGLGGLGSLAAMAGFNLDAMQGGSSELSPIVYPQIVQSIPFQKIIMHTPLTWSGSTQQRSLLYYYDSIYKPNPLTILKKYTMGLPGVLLKLLKGSETKVGTISQTSEPLVSLTEKEKDMCTSLKTGLTLEANSKEGYIALTAKAPEAFAAAQMALNAQQLLQNQIIELKIVKAKQNLAFVESLFKEKETDFHQAQARLASYRDRNRNLNTAMALTEVEQLQSELQISVSVFTEIAKQYENAKIKVKEDTPIFSIIQPVSIPTEKSKPQKPMIVAIWFFLGGVIGVGWIFGRQYAKQLKNKWKTTNIVI